MSRIYFHSEAITAEVRGSERHYFSWMASQLLWAVLETHAQDYAGESAPLRKLFPLDHYVHSSHDFKSSAKMALSGISTAKLFLNGREIELFALQLNTGYSIGNDALKLAMRLHGQCEIHTYVEGQNRSWLADIIRQGRAVGFYRSEAGWEQVIDLLESADDAPVVTSYSVCEQFPNGGVANYDYPIVDGENNYDAWYDLSHEERWLLGLSGLRAGGGDLELKPDNWQTFFFRDGLNGFHLSEELLTKVSVPA